MNYDALKERLHGYIEHADQEKVLAIYTLISNDIGTGVHYDEATVRGFDETLDNMISGKEKTYTLEQTLENIWKNRNKHGV